MHAFPVVSKKTINARPIETAAVDFVAPVREDWMRLGPTLRIEPRQRGIERLPFPMLAGNGNVDGQLAAHPDEPQFQVGGGDGCDCMVKRAWLGIFAVVIPDKAGRVLCKQARQMVLHLFAEFAVCKASEQLTNHDLSIRDTAVKGDIGQ